MRRVVFALLALAVVGCGEDITSENYLERAHTYADEADFESARIELKNALQLDSSNAEARCLLGQLHLEVGNLLDAEKELERGRALGCPDDAVLPLLAQTQLARGEFQSVLALEPGQIGADARSHLLSLQAIASLFLGQAVQADELVALALEASPQSTHAQLAAARIEALSGDSGKAIRMIDSVLGQAPENHEAWRLKGHTYWRMLQLREAREAFGQSIANTRLPIADHVSRGLINIQMEDYAAAQRDAAELAEIAVHHPGSSYIGGLLLFRAGEYRDAITMLALGEAAAQKYPLLLFYLGVAHLIDGDAKVAETYAKRFLEMKPESLEARRFVAALYLQRGAVEAVENVLRPVLDYDADDLGALNLMANALMQSDRADLAMFTYDWIGKTYPDVVLEDLQVIDGLFTSRLALSARDAVAAAFKPLAQFPREDIFTILAALKAGDRKAAREAAMSYKWRDLTGVAPHNVLGNVFVAIDNEKEARMAYEQALKRDPTDPSANLGLAKLERKAENVKKERALYQTILRGDQNHLPTLLSLAVLEGREGNNDRMEDLLRDAIDRHPDAVEPRLGLARYYIDSGRPHRVERVFESLVGLQKHSEKVRSLRYAALVVDERVDEAMAIARQEFARNPNTQTMLEVTVLHRSAGENEKLVQVLQDWVRVSPEDITARLTLASELEATDLAAANEQYEAILRLDPNHVVALNNMAWNRRNVEPAAALVQIRKAVALAPRRVPVLDSLAVIAHLNGEHEEASEAITKAVERAPNNLSLQYHEAMINAGMGKTEKAIASLKSMLNSEDVEFAERQDAQALLRSLRQQGRASQRS